jgi:hypothetical protein
MIFLILIPEWLESLVNNRYAFSVLTAAVFMILSLPWTYSQTNRIPSIQTIASNSNCSTSEGRLLHTGLFFVIIYLLMKWLNLSNLPDNLIAKYSFLAALIYFLLNSIESISLLSKIPYLEDGVDEFGCQNRKGVIVHGLIFLVIYMLVVHFLID